MPSCWMFVRRARFIHVARCGPLTVAIDGPHRSLGKYRFESDQQLQSFQVALAEELTERGWLLCSTAGSRGTVTPIALRGGLHGYTAHVASGRDCRNICGE